MAAVMFPNDKAIIARHRQIAEVIDGAMVDVTARSSTIGALAEVVDTPPVRPSVALPAAETNVRSDVQADPLGTAGDRPADARTSAPPAPPAHLDELAITCSESTAPGVYPRRVAKRSPVRRPPPPISSQIGSGRW